MTKSAILGYTRIGKNRELKKALEAFWKGNSSEAELQNTAKSLRVENWNLIKDAGIEIIPSNDFSFYDQMLDTAFTLGALPARFEINTNDEFKLADYFAVARGTNRAGENIQAGEMTKWFNTNYHYIVPEFSAGQQFKLFWQKPVEEFKEALAAGIKTRPVIIGPVSFLLLGKSVDGSHQLDLLDNLIPAYNELFAALAAAGAEEVQIDEPWLVMELDNREQDAFKKAFAALDFAGLKSQLTAYFDDFGANLDLALSLDTDAIHFDLVRGADQLDEILQKLPASKGVSLGVVEGRNIWKNNFENSLSIISKFNNEDVTISSSCSLLHSPYDLDVEDKIDSEVKNWLAFAKQKLSEIALLTKAVSEGEGAIATELEANKAAWAARKSSALINNASVKERFAAITAADFDRSSDFEARKSRQAEILGLPDYPTTTIGSFPQTQEVRKARVDHKSGNLSDADYQKFLEDKTIETIRFQEKVGLDVLVHGEFERNDMVEYFGEQLDGFAFSKNGWVQSYGSRCVKPPIIFGDVARPNAMTVTWSKFAQEQTDAVMKGMLTGPVTTMFWSFIRDDQPLKDTCFQIALALQDEVLDLEAAGIKAIQIDEPAIREGLPLKKSERPEYLDWAVKSYRLSQSKVKDETQIHTHMCYSEFNDMIQDIAQMDADVISIEASRSKMDILESFKDFKYPNDIGLGVYDIHSPNIPGQDEMFQLLKKAQGFIEDRQIWVNPDCGLKTRGWVEVEESLRNMVNAARQLRGDNGSAAAA